MKLNKKGFSYIVYPLILVGIVGVTAFGLGETANNGILKRNGQTIWCKMQNKGADFCNAQYGYTENK